MNEARHRGPGSGLDRFFAVSERGSTVSRELRGGLVTFITMSYIVVLNPLIIGSFSPDDAAAKRDVLGATLPVAQVAAVTALVAGVVFNAVPDALKAAIAAGIGLFICFIGLVDAGFVRRLPDAANTTVPVGLGINGSIASWPTLVFAVGLLVTAVLMARQVKAAILLGVLFSTVLAIIVEAATRVGPSLGTNPKGWSLGTIPSPTASAPGSSATCCSSRPPGRPARSTR